MKNSVKNVQKFFEDKRKTYMVTSQREKQLFKLVAQMINLHKYMEIS